MSLEKNFSLREYNSFGLDAKAAYFVSIDSEKELQTFISSQSVVHPLFVLGGGSNILLTRDFEGTIIKNGIKGIKIIEEDKDYALVEIGGGDVWHDTVLWCIDHELGGIENLSLIPGSVGAAPIQNIGAYGRELKDCFHSLDAIRLDTGEKESFDYSDCAFGYRDSHFKREGKGKYMITKVRLKLDKNHSYHTSYGAIQAELQRLGVAELSIRAISEAVINIRQSKLPDPAEIGNSGSFFKNPVVSRELFQKIQSDFPNAPNYPAPNGVKLAAGWLIEQCGWKGFREGEYGVHKNQALVLVNYGGAKGSDIYNLSSRILESVKAKFGVELEREVQIF